MKMSLYITNIKKFLKFNNRLMGKTDLWNEWLASWWNRYYFDFKTCEKYLKKD